MPELLSLIESLKPKPLDHKLKIKMQFLFVFIFRAALLFAHGDLSWDKFHILICRSTTPDLIKMVSKLDEFIRQQFTSSKRALGAIGPIPGSIRHKTQDKNKSGDEESCMFF